MKVLRIISIILLVFLGVSATYGGYSLLSDPTGSRIQLPIQLIQSTVFKDYFIPGFVLFVMNGMMGLGSASIAIFKGTYYPLLTVLQGIIVICWIVVQILVIQHVFWLQFVFLGVGSMLIVLGILLRNAPNKISST